MPAPAYTYTLTNGSTADASQVTQNFNDILNGVTDGTKNLSISALTVGGAATFNGAMNFGSASDDDITILGSLASSFPVKTNTSYNIGAATLGLLSVYIGGTSTYTTRILGAATSTWTLTLPVDGGSSGTYLQTNGSGTTSWAKTAATADAITSGFVTSFVPVAKSGVKAVASADYTILDNDGYSIVNVTTGASDRTMTLPTAADNAGRYITIAKADSGAGFVIVDGEGAETINGAATNTLHVQYAFLTLLCNGTTWIVVAVKDSVTGTASSVACASSGTANDVTSVIVTPGEWDISLQYSQGASGSTGTRLRGGIGTASGSAETGLAAASNAFDGAAATAAYNVNCSISSYRVVVTSSTTYYLKQILSYSGGSPEGSGTLTARRVG